MGNCTLLARRTLLRTLCTLLSVALVVMLLHKYRSSLAPGCLRTMSWADAISDNRQADQSPIGPRTSFLNRSKIATMIEPRNEPLLLPVLHNFMALMPADWPFLIWCSSENLHILQNSRSLRQHLESGKLEVRMLPIEYAHSKLGTLSISTFLTGTWFWDQFHPEAQYVLMFQADSILCSHAEGTVDDWLGYDYVGGPTDWAPDGRGGNGGFSIRKISSMQRITRDFAARLTTLEKSAEFLWPVDWFNRPELRSEHYFTAEDVFFVHTLQTMQSGEINSDIRWPIEDGYDQAAFSLDIWNPARSIEERRPLGIHMGANIHPFVVRYEDNTFTEKSKALVDYCPEVLLLRFGLPLPDQGKQASEEILRHPE